MMCGRKWRRYKVKGWRHGRIDFTMNGWAAGGLRGEKKIKAQRREEEKSSERQTPFFSTLSWIRRSVHAPKRIFCAVSYLSCERRIYYRRFFFFFFNNKNLQIRPEVDTVHWACVRFRHRTTCCYQRVGRVRAQQPTHDKYANRESECVERINAQLVRGRFSSSSLYSGEIATSYTRPVLFPSSITVILFVLARISVCSQTILLNAFSFSHRVWSSYAHTRRFHRFLYRTHAI